MGHSDERQEAFAEASRELVMAIAGLQAADRDAKVTA